MLNKYASHVERNPNTLLAKIYGCYTIAIENIESLNLILIENSFQRLGTPELVYDLKGSIYNRLSTSSIKKDLNLL